MCATLHARGPPLGWVELTALPPSSTPTHRRRVGHESATKFLPWLWTWMTFQLRASRGLVELPISPR
ncbi:MAG: hypothetical protein M3Y17_00475 [Actinomycetota bacterium]|nr:hypothetical protein [Actinomycetota bacterium]